MQDDHKSLERLIIAYVYTDYECIESYHNSTNAEKSVSQSKLRIELRSIDDALMQSKALPKQEKTALTIKLVTAKLKYLQTFFDFDGTDDFRHDWGVLGMALADRYIFNELRYNIETAQKQSQSLQAQKPKHWNDRNIKRARFFDSLLTHLRNVVSQGILPNKRYTDAYLAELILEIENDKYESTFVKLRRELHLGRFGSSSIDTITSSVSNGRNFISIQATLN